MTVAGWTETPEVVEIASLIRDDHLLPREGVDQETVAEYAEAMQEEGANFPPVHAIEEIQSGALLLVDGWHRVAAAERGFTSLYARVRKGTWDDAAEVAAAANAKHGRRRTSADKRKAVKMLLALPKWAQASDREIAKHCTVSHDLVGAVRRGLGPSGDSARYEQLTENIEPPPPERRVVHRGGQEYPITIPRERGPVQPIQEEPNVQPIKGRSESNRPPKAPPSDRELVIRNLLAGFDSLSYPEQTQFERARRLTPRPVAMGDIGAWGATALDSELSRVMAAFFNRIRSDAGKLKFFYETVKPWLDAYERDNPDHEPCDDENQTTEGDGS
jgi:hypothetical protein